MKRIVFIVSGLLVLALGIFYLYKAKPKPEINTKAKVSVTKSISNLAPDFTLNDLTGKSMKLSDFKGKVVILDFWATWCPPCRAELPHFIELYNEYQNKGLEIVGVALDIGGINEVKSFSENMGVNYTVLLGNRAVADRYGGIFSIPTTYVINKEGAIIKKYIGYRDKEVFEADIKALL